MAEVVEAEELRDTGHFFKFLGPVRVSTEEDCLDTDTSFSSCNVAVSNRHGVCIFSDFLGLHVFDLAKLRSLAASNKGKNGGDVATSAADALFSAPVPGIRRVVLSQDEEVIALLLEDNTLQFASISDLLSQQRFSTLDSLTYEADEPLSDFLWLPPNPGSTIPSYLLLTQSHTVLRKTLGSSQAAQAYATNVSAFCVNPGAGTMSDVCVVVADISGEDALPSVVFMKPDGGSVNLDGLELPYLDLEEGERGVIDTLKWLGPNSLLVGAIKCDMSSMEETGDTAWQGVLTWPEGSLFPSSADDCSLHEFFPANTDSTVTESLSGPYCCTAVLPPLGCAITAHRKAGDDHIRVLAYEPQVGYIDISEDKLAVRIPNAMDDQENFVVGMGVDLTDPEPVHHPLDGTKPDVTQCATLIVATSNGSLLLYRFGQIDHPPDLQLITQSLPVPTSRPAWLQQLGAEPDGGQPPRSAMDPSAVLKGVMTSLPSDEEDDADSGEVPEEEDKIGPLGAVLPGSSLPAFPPAATTASSLPLANLPPATLQGPTAPSLPFSAAGPAFPFATVPAPPDSASDSLSSDESSTSGTPTAPLPSQQSGSPLRPFPTDLIEQAAPKPTSSSSAFSASAPGQPSILPAFNLSLTPASTGTTAGTVPSFTLPAAQPTSAAAFGGFGFGGPAAGGTSAPPSISFAGPQTAGTLSQGQTVTTNLAASAALKDVPKAPGFTVTGPPTGSFGSPAAVPAPQPFNSSTSAFPAASLSNLFATVTTTAPAAPPAGPAANAPKPSASRVITIPPAASSAPFGATTALSAPAFGATPGSSAPAFGGAFGAPAVSSAPAFGGAFGAPPASSAAGFGGGFGAPPASSAPAFGGGFGTAAVSSAPAFGGASSEAPGSSAPGFGGAFGTPTVSTGAAWGGGVASGPASAAAPGEKRFVPGSQPAQTTAAAQFGSAAASSRKSPPAPRPTQEAAPRASRAPPKLSVTPPSVKTPTPRLSALGDPIASTEADFLKKTLHTVRQLAATTDAYFKAAENERTTVIGQLSNASQQLQKRMKALSSRVLKSMDENKELSSEIVKSSRGVHQLQTFRPYTSYQQCRDLNLPLEPELDAQVNNCKALLEKVKTQLWDLEEFADKAAAAAAAAKEAAAGAAAAGGSTPRSVGLGRGVRVVSGNRLYTPGGRGAGGKDSRAAQARQQQYSATTIYTIMNSASLSIVQLMEEIERLSEKMDELDIPVSQSDIHFELEGLSGIKLDDQPTPRSILRPSTNLHTSAAGLPSTPKMKLSFASPVQTPLRTPATSDSGPSTKRRIMHQTGSATGTPSHAVLSQIASPSPSASPGSIPTPANLAGHPLTPLLVKSTRTSQGRVRMKVVDNPLHSATPAVPTSRVQSPPTAAAAKPAPAAAPGFGFDKGPAASAAPAAAAAAAPFANTTGSFPPAGAFRMRSAADAAAAQGAVSRGRAPAVSSLDVTSSNSVASSQLQQTPSEEASTATSNQRATAKGRSKRTAQPPSFDENDQEEEGSGGGGVAPFGAAAFGAPGAFSLTPTGSSTGTGPMATSFASFFGAPSGGGFGLPASKGWLAGNGASAGAGQGGGGQVPTASWLVETKGTAKDQQDAASKGAAAGGAQRPADGIFSLQAPPPGTAAAAAAAAATARAEAAMKLQTAAGGSDQGRGGSSSTSSADQRAGADSEGEQGPAKRAFVQPPVPNMADMAKAQQLLSKVTQKAAQPPVPDMSAIQKAQQFQAQVANKAAAQPPVPDPAAFQKAQQLQAPAGKVAAQPPVPDMAAMGRAQQLQAQASKKAAQPPIPDMAAMAKAQELVTKAPQKAAAPPVPDMGALAKAQQLQAQVAKTAAAQPPVPPAGLTAQAQQLEQSQTSSTATSTPQPPTSQAAAIRPAGSQPPVPDLSTVLAAQKLSAAFTTQAGSAPQASSSVFGPSPASSSPFVSTTFGAFGAASGAAFNFSNAPTSQPTTTVATSTPPPSSSPLSQPASAPLTPPASSPLTDAATSAAAASPTAAAFSSSSAFGAMSSLSLSTTPGTSTASPGKPGPFGLVSSAPAFAAPTPTSSAPTSGVFSFSNPPTAAATSAAAPSDAPLGTSLSFQLPTSSQPPAPAFGLTATTAAASAPSLTPAFPAASSPFGAATSTGGVFGSQAAASSSPFGALSSSSAASSPFGALTSSPAASSPFGVATSSPAASSPFNVPTSSPAASSPFGVTTSSPAPVGAWGLPPPASAGAPAFASAAAASPGFGTAASTPGFGANTLGSSFGSFGLGGGQSSSAFGASQPAAGGVFGGGGSNPFPAFSSNNTQPQAATSVFNTAAPTSGPFASPFSAPAFSSSPFGAPTSSSSPAAAAAAPFGQSATLGSAFGTPAGFGATSSALGASSVFGATATPGAFSAPAAPSNPTGIPGFGQSAGFGAGGAGAGFGAGGAGGNAFAAFSNQGGSGFAAAAKTGTGFGSAAPFGGGTGVSPFGGAPAAAAPFGGAPAAAAPFGGGGGFGGMGQNMFATLSASSASSNPALWAPRK